MFKVDLLTACVPSKASCVIAYQKSSASLHFLPSSCWFALNLLSTSSLLSSPSLQRLSSLRPARIPPCAHTCGFCQFIIVETDPAASQRASCPPHSDIFQPTAFGRALERPLASCLLSVDAASCVLVVPVRWLPKKTQQPL